MKKQTVATIALIIVAAIGGAFYYFAGKEYVFHFSEAQLREKLNAKLPLTKTYLLIFQITLDNPRVSLTNNSDRVDAGLDIVLNITVGPEAKPLGGTVDASGGIKYVSDRGEFYLTDPIIEHLEVQGIPKQYVEKVSTALTKALAAYYTDHPIYSLKSTDAKQVAAKLVLKKVVVENHEVVVTLGI